MRPGTASGIGPHLYTATTRCHRGTDISVLGKTDTSRHEKWRSAVPGAGRRRPSPIAIVFPRSVTKMHGYEYPWSPLRLQMETYGLNKATSVCLNRILLCRLDRIPLPQPKKKTRRMSLAARCGAHNRPLLSFAPIIRGESEDSRSLRGRFRKALAAGTPASVLVIECIVPHWMVLEWKGKKVNQT